MCVLLGLFALQAAVAPADSTTPIVVPPVAPAQGVRVDEPLVWVVSDHRLDRERSAELRGTPQRAPLLLRSTASLLDATRSELGMMRILPELHLIGNSRLPFSLNDGALWAGRGTSMRVSGGFRYSTGRVTINFVPELNVAANGAFLLRQPGFAAPIVPPDRSRFTLPWYSIGPYSIDMPTRYGESGVRRLDPGQSSIAVRVRGLTVGGATESHWWGPGVRNALILSNNAGGFPHLFVRPTAPIATPLGDVDFRWLAGGLSESAYFDTVSTNDVRSLSAAAVTLRLRRAPNLTIGAARSVWATATGWGEIPLRWFDVLKGTSRIDDAVSDSTLQPGGREQLFSLFARWVFPPAGVELYTEWGRSSLPSSLRDLLVAPNHTQAYTLGLQWVRDGLSPADFWRLSAENTTTEQGATFRDHPLGVWYTSRRVIQGYTQRGQPLGAAVGPGSSAQSVAIDYVRPGGWYGLKFGRMRLNEDVRSLYPFPDYQRWCTHDIYVHWGFRAGSHLPFGVVAADVTFGNRLHPWFQVQSGCPRGDAMVDIRNNTLSVTFAPFAR